MVSVLSLWLPILLSAVVVFVASSVIHMVLSYHKNDLMPLPDEEGVRRALKPFSIPPGNYIVPRASSSKEMQSDAHIQKLKEGPVAFLSVLENKQPSMGKSLTQWFVYCIVVSIFAGYVAGAAYGPGSRYLDVFQFAGTTAFAGYSLALIQDSIWSGKKWSSTIKSVIDGLIYASLTAGIFGWLWP